MIKEELQRLSRNPKFLDDFSEALAALKRSGVVDVLRLLGQPHLVFDGRDTPALAAQAARSIGWNGAINTLLNFEELVTEAVNPQAAPRMEYGGLERAVKSGDILKEEADAIRSGQPIPKPKSAGSKPQP